MPAALSYPGVYIEEVPSGARAISGVATSIAAFIGRTIRGPVSEPKTIGSYAEFERLFGGLWADSTLGYAVRDFYLNGGSQAVIVRLFDSGGTGLIAAKAVVDAIVASHAGGENDLVDLVAAADGAKSGAPGSEAATASTAVATAVHTANGSGATPDDLIEAANAAMQKIADDAYAAAVAKIAADNLALKAASPGKWGDKLRVRVDHDVDPDADGKDKLFNLYVYDGVTKAVELFRAVSVDPNHPRAVNRVLESQSELVRVEGSLPATPPDASDPPDPGKSEWGDEPATANYKVASDKGDDGGPLSGSANFTPPGAEGSKTGLYALDRVDLFNLLCIPPHRQEGDIETGLINAAAAYCLKRRAMLIVDPPSGWTTKDQARDGVETVADSTANAALYFPRLIQADPMRDDQERSFVPCGAVAGVFARIDTARGVWKAPAGLDANLINAPKLSVVLTDLENGELNMRGVNCLRTMAGAGRVVWGSRTLKGNDRLASEWKYVPVRRTALFIEESLYRGTHWVVFEPNDEPLWASIRLNVGAFMQRMFRQGAFQGSSPREAYFVKCDKDTTTQADIDLGIVNVLVGFAPLKPAEFVVIKLQQMAGNIPT